MLTNYNKERKLPAKTVDEWERIFARFITMHGDLLIAQVAKGHVVKFKDALVAEEKAPKTIERQVGALRRVFGWAAGNDIIPTNPAAGVKVAAGKTPKESREHTAGPACPLRVHVGCTRKERAAYAGPAVRCAGMLTGAAMVDDLKNRCPAEAGST